MIVSRVFAAVGALLASAVLWVCGMRQDAPAWVVGNPAGAAECVQEFSESISRGDFAGASQFLSGTPTLEIPEGTETEDQLWEAFVDSVTCIPQGDSFPTAAGVARKVRIRSLSLSNAADAMQELTHSLLTERIRAAEDMEEVYTDEHEYRPEFLSQLLRDAAEAALDAAPRMEQELTLQLSNQDGEWKIVPDSALMAALSGGIVENPTPKTGAPREEA